MAREPTLLEEVGMGEETKERKQKKGGKMEDPASGKGLLCGGVFCAGACVERMDGKEQAVECW